MILVTIVKTIIIYIMLNNYYYYKMVHNNNTIVANKIKFQIKLTLFMFLIDTLVETVMIIFLL